MAKQEPIEAMELTKDTKEYVLGEGKLIYVPRWANDPDALYEESKKLSFTPEIVPQFGKAVEIKKRKTVDYGLEYGSLLSKLGCERRG